MSERRAGWLGRAILVSGLLSLAGCAGARYRSGWAAGYDAMDKIVRTDSSISWWDIGYIKGSLLRAQQYQAETKLKQAQRLLPPAEQEFLERAAMQASKKATDAELEQALRELDASGAFKQ